MIATARTKRTVWRRLSSTAGSRAGYLLFVIFGCFWFLVGCSSPEPAQPDPVAVDETPEASDGIDSSGDEGDTAEPVDTNSDAAREAADAADDAGATHELDDEDLADIIRVEAGVQVEDAQGNLVTIYGFARWSDAFAALPDGTQQAFGFYGDVDQLTSLRADLLAFDVGMCSAGIDARGFGTAEFFAHLEAIDPLSADPVFDRGVLAHHPVLQPGFAFPNPATCARGWLPVLWSHQDQDPEVARYVLANRASASDEIERYVYQWNIEPIDLASNDLASNDLASNDVVTDDGTTDVLVAGQQVQFNGGGLEGATVTFEGWAELVGIDGPLPQTRLVGVWATWCSGGTADPAFGLAVDGWNIVAPNADAAVTPPDRQPQPDGNGCTKDWLEFAVPFGGEPTGFFVSDGRDPADGYAEWTLDGSARPAPE